MRKLILYLTLSVDGFIADAEGGVAWLSGAPGEDYGYADFYRSVEGVLLGRRTYEQIVGWGGSFPYPDKPVYVFTSNPRVQPVAPNVSVVVEPAAEYVARLKLDAGGPLWLGGGGSLARTLLDARLVDEIDLFTQPVILGDGIPLFEPRHARLPLELIETREWPAGIVENRYRVRSEWRALEKP